MSVDRAPDSSACLCKRIAHWPTGTTVTTHRHSRVTTVANLQKSANITSLFETVTGWLMESLLSVAELGVAFQDQPPWVKAPSSQRYNKQSHDLVSQGKR